MTSYLLSLKTWALNHRDSKAVRALRRLLQQKENLKLKAWEWWHFLSYRPPSDGEMIALLRRMGVNSFSEFIVWQQHGKAEQASFINPAHAIKTLKEQYSEEIPVILHAARQVVKGHFSLLGSASVDMRRNSRSPGYALDWSRDPITGARFHRIFDYRRWHQPEVRSGNPDVKGPWEIGRMQHFAILGQAYGLTNDPQYARCFAHTITNFMQQNPVGCGVQWACPMDVALRLVSWIIGISFFARAPELNQRWWKRFCKGLIEHGRFIAANLEFGTLNQDIVTSNHYLTNLFGLYWLALAFPALDNNCVWRGLSERGLEHEILYQTHADGGNFESSVSYHGLVMEMLLSAYALSLHHKVPLSTTYRDRLLAGFCFLKTLRQPSGRQPQIGDADNGRAHIFSQYLATEPDNLDHLLVAGAHVFSCPELAEGIPTPKRVEMIFWGMPTSAPIQQPIIPRSLIFPDSGIGVLRTENVYFLMSNTPAGTKGFSNHKHNDHLAIEWVVDGQPLIVDAGSYTYTRDPKARNCFRGTAIHNTVMIDGEEQNRFNPEWLFRMDNDAKGSISCATAMVDHIQGYHTGYQRLPGQVTHRRLATLNDDQSIHLLDIFDSEDSKISHEFRWQFLLYPGVGAIVKGSQISLRGNGINAQINCDTPIEWKLVESWYSRGYGYREKTMAIVGVFVGIVDKVEFVLAPNR